MSDQKKERAAGGFVVTAKDRKAIVSERNEPKSWNRLLQPAGWGGEEPEDGGIALLNFLRELKEEFGPRAYAIVLGKTVKIERLVENDGKKFATTFGLVFDGSADEFLPFANADKESTTKAFKAVSLSDVFVSNDGYEKEVGIPEGVNAFFKDNLAAFQKLTSLLA